jgi:hypothetical protein
MPSIGQQGYVPIAIDVLCACHKYHLWTVLSECNQVPMEEPKTVRSSSYIFTSRVRLMSLRRSLEPDANKLSVVRECCQLVVVPTHVGLLPCQD